MQWTGEQDKLCVETAAKLRVNRSWVRIWRDAEPSVCRGCVPLPSLPWLCLLYSFMSVGRVAAGDSKWRYCYSWQTRAQIRVQWILVHSQRTFQDTEWICLITSFNPILSFCKVRWWPCVCGSEKPSDFSVFFPFFFFYSFLSLLFWVSASCVYSSWY